MIQVIHDGASWSVRRDGEYIQAAGSAGVFLTKEGAIDYAKDISERTGEVVDVAAENDAPDNSYFATLPSNTKP